MLYPKALNPKLKIIFLLISILLLATGLIFLNPDITVTDFKSCVEAGSLVMESYPRQCRSNGKTYVEEITWENDGIILMQNQETREFACFGCNNRLCIDPAPIMQQIEETEERHCSSDFELLENN